MSSPLQQCLHHSNVCGPLKLLVTLDCPSIFYDKLTCDTSLLRINRVMKFNISVIIHFLSKVVTIHLPLATSPGCCDCACAGGTLDDSLRTGQRGTPALAILITSV